MKCNEIHPRCGQCSRLQLTCVYQPASLTARKTRKLTASSRPRSNTAPESTSPAIQPTPPLVSPGQWAPPLHRASLEVETAQLAEIEEPLSAPRHLETTTTSWLSEDTSLPVGEDFWRPDILGEESFWSQLPIFSQIPTNDDHSMFENFPRGGILPQPDGGPATTFLDRPAGIADPAGGRTGGNLTYESLFGSQMPAGDALQSPMTVLSFTDIPSNEVSLLRHFVDFAVPPILIGVEPRWTTARHALFKIAKSNLLVRHAICSFAALSLADDGNRSKGSNRTSAHFYDLALGELQAEIDGLTGGSKDVKQREHILASVFFLSYVELMKSSAPRHTLELLSRAYAISRETQPSRSLLGNQLRIWLKLLDARVVSAGGEGVHLVNNPDVKDLEAASAEPEPSSDSMDDGEDPVTSNAATQSDTEEILFNCINHSAYNFYVQVLDFAGRIARSDRWHRPRGSVADELEVMQAAQKILDDLDTLWGQRPGILDLVGKEHDQLTRHLSDRLAKNVQTHIRNFVANFYACYVHVQRALFPHLATTSQTSEAVQHIVDLVRLSERDHIKLSVSMLWPLMMAGCEANDAATRAWLIATVEGMNGGLGNAARTARLIREICRRQEDGHRADARTVMQEIFGTIFAII